MPYAIDITIHKSSSYLCQQITLDSCIIHPSCLQTHLFQQIPSLYEHVINIIFRMNSWFDLLCCGDKFWLVHVEWWCCGHGWLLFMKFIINCQAASVHLQLHTYHHKPSSMVASSQSPVLLRELEVKGRRQVLFFTRSFLLSPFFTFMILESPHPEIDPKWSPSKWSFFTTLRIIDAVL